MERIYNYRPTWDLEVFEPIAGNYYPLTAAMYVQDDSTAGREQQLSILTDRSQAGASLRSGDMELLQIMLLGELFELTHPQFLTFSQCNILE